MNESENQQLLSPEEAGEILHISASTVKRWLREGHLPGIKVGKLWKIDKKDITKLISQQRNGIVIVPKKIFNSFAEVRESISRSPQFPDYIKDFLNNPDCIPYITNAYVEYVRDQAKQIQNKVE